MGHVKIKETMENGKKVIEVRYWGVWFDHSFIYDHNIKLQNLGFKVRQYVNGALAAASNDKEEGE